MMQNDKTRTRVMITRLADGTHVDDRFFITDPVFVVQIFRGVKVRLGHKYAGNMGMADKAQMCDAVKNALDFNCRGINIIREYIFIDRLRAKPAGMSGHGY